MFSPSRQENHEAVDEAPDTESAATLDPYINPILSPNVVAVLGKEARLKCYVTGLGNKTVSSNLNEISLMKIRTNKVHNQKTEM